MTALARDENALRALLDHHLPAHPIATLTYLGEGLENTVYETDNGLIVRIAKRPVRAAATRRDVDLLTTVAALLTVAHCPVAVPTPMAVDPEAGLLVYRKVPGRSLLAAHFGTTDTADPGHANANRVVEPQTGKTSEAMARPLGELLTVLHTASVAEWASLLGEDDEPMGRRLTDTVTGYQSIFSLLPAAHRRSVEFFLDAEPPTAPRRLVFAHNDLGAEHLVIDTETGALTGVIDWTDAAIADPARDFGRLLRDLGPAGHDAVLDHYRGPYSADDRDRAVFYARCSLIEDIAYGVEQDQPMYVRAAMAHFAHTFGDPDGRQTSGALA